MPYTFRSVVNLLMGEVMQGNVALSAFRRLLSLFSGQVI